MRNEAAAWNFLGWFLALTTFMRFFEFSSDFISALLFSFHRTLCYTTSQRDNNCSPNPSEKRWLCALACEPCAVCVSFIRENLFTLSMNKFSPGKRITIVPSNAWVSRYNTCWSHCFFWHQAQWNTAKLTKSIPTGTAEKKKSHHSIGLISIFVWYCTQTPPLNIAMSVNSFSGAMDGIISFTLIEFTPQPNEIISEKAHTFTIKTATTTESVRNEW